MANDNQETTLQQTFEFIVRDGIRLYTANFLDKTNSYQYTRPFYMQISGEEQTVSSWADAVVLLCDFFIKKSKAEFKKAADGFTPTWTKRVMISANTDNKFVYPKPLANGMFVETNTDSLHLVWMLDELCKKMKFDTKNLVVLYKKRPKEEAPEVRDFYKGELRDQFLLWLQQEKNQSGDRVEKNAQFFEKLDKILVRVQKNAASLYLFDYNRDSVVAKDTLLKFAETRYIDKPDVVRKVEQSMDWLIEFYQFKNNKSKKSANTQVAQAVSAE